MKDLTPLSLGAPVVGFPARIIVITRPDGVVIRCAESDEAIKVEGDTYVPVPGLVVSAIEQTSNGDMPSCQIVAVHKGGATFDSADIDLGLFDGAKVQIYTVDRRNLTRKGLLFTGAISNIAVDPIEHRATFDVKGLAALTRIVMTQKRSPMCRTDLYSPLCGVDSTSYAVATTVAAITDAFRFTVTGSLAQATNYFNQGVLVTANGKSIRIATWDQPSQTLRTYLPATPLLSVGLGLTLYRGCNKTLGAGGCADFGNHGNQLNFQGEPHFLGTAAAAQQV